MTEDIRHFYEYCQPDWEVAELVITAIERAQIGWLRYAHDRDGDYPNWCAADTNLKLGSYVWGDNWYWRFEIEHHGYSHQDTSPTKAWKYPITDHEIPNRDIENIKKITEFMGYRFVPHPLLTKCPACYGICWEGAVRELPEKEYPEDSSWFTPSAGCPSCQGEIRRRNTEYSSWVYFIRSTGNGLIKIGTSNNPQKRLRTLQVNNPEKLEILKTIRGSFSTEAYLHRQFKACQERGEWHNPMPELIDYINNVEEMDLFYEVT